MSEAVVNKNSELIATRWAKALMELALEDEKVSKEDILDDLREISNTIKSSDELDNVINNPSVSVSEKQVVLCKLFQNNVVNTGLEEQTEMENHLKAFIQNYTNRMIDNTLCE